MNQLAAVGSEVLLDLLGNSIVTRGRFLNLRKRGQRIERSGHGRVCASLAFPWPASLQNPFPRLLRPQERTTMTDGAPDAHRKTTEHMVSRAPGRWLIHT